MQRCEIVPAKYSGSLKVYIQGDIKNRAGKIVFLTVHDVGYNHTTFQPFVDHVSMTQVKEKSVWLHVCLPGQDEHDENLPDDYVFPSLDGFAHDLYFVLERFNVGTIVGIGEGAGSNILCRLGLYYPNRCLGLILIDCTSNTAGFDEYIKYTVFNWKEGGNKMVDKVLKFLTYHKRGTGRVDDWKQAMNPQNLSKFLDVYLKRTDISPLVANELRAESLVVVGKESPYLQQSKSMVDTMDKRHTTLLVMDDLADPLFKAPKNLARALVLFCKGCGVLMGVPMVGLENEYKRVKEKQSANSVQLSIAMKVLSDERTERHKGEGSTLVTKKMVLVARNTSRDDCYDCGNQTSCTSDYNEDNNCLWCPD